MAVLKRKTHFEQVSIEQVRRLLKRVANDKGKKNGRVWKKVVVERPVTKTEPYSVIRLS